MTGCNLIDFGKPARQNGKRLPCECLMDENAELHEQVSSLVGRSFRTADKMSCIEAENAKLRELVKSVLVLRHDPAYKWLDATFAEVFGKSFTEQARELGVEDDG